MERGTRRDEERKQGVKMPGEVGARNRQSRMNLKLILRGSVEMQAQHGPDRLDKRRAGWDEDRSARPGSEDRIHEEPEGC